MDMIHLTKQLIEQLHRLKNKFETENPPENRRDQQFFEKVKQEILPIFSSLENWEQGALEIVKQRKVNLHPAQISSTKENMELLIMHSYYKDARIKRFMELYQSSLYIFDQLIAELDQQQQGE